MIREFHPTKRLLVETASRLLTEKSATQITTDEILEMSGVSRGSMYHHFDELDELLETTQIYEYSLWVNSSIKFMYDKVLTSRTKDELRSSLSLLTEITQSDQHKAARARRAHALALCATNQRLAEKLGLEIQRLTDAIKDVAIELQEKGLLKASVDAHSLSTFIQAYTIGKIVNDVNPDPIKEQNWINFIMTIVENTFLDD